MGTSRDVKVPDIGEFKDVDVIEVLVSPGDTVTPDAPLITLETDKASMDVPSPAAGKVKEVKIKVGDKVSEGSLILTLEAEEAAAPKEESKPSAPPAAETEEPAPKAQAPSPAAPKRREPPVTPAKTVDEEAFAKVHASPAVRRFARELGVDIGKLSEGSGRKGRITQDDVCAYVKRMMTGEIAAATPAAAPGAGAGIPPIPAVDFSKFGDTETKALTKIKRLTGTNLSRAWLNVPHVTHHDEADITDVEAFRKSLTEEAKKRDVRVTMLSFLLKASAAALKAFPTFNASLNPTGESLIFKKYFHIGVAVDTPDGLVVPVLRDVDRKSIFALSAELGEAQHKSPH